MLKESSKAFKEFISKRCEEVLQGNEEIQRINGQIVAIENELKESFTSNQLKLYISIEGLSTFQKEREGNLLYISGFKDGH